MTDAALESIAHATRGLKHFSARAIARTGYDGGLRIHLVGYLDGEAASVLQPVITTLIESWDGQPRVVFVLDALEYISSLGVGMLITAKAVAQQRGFLHVLENSQPPVRNVLELLGVFTYLSLQDRPPSE